MIPEAQFQAEVKVKRKAWENEPDSNENDQVQEVNRSKWTKRQRKEQELLQDSDDEINYGIWGPPTTEILDRQKDQMTDMERAGGIESSLPVRAIAPRLIPTS